jgi:hypothetical protein
MRMMSTNYSKLKVSNHFLLHQLLRKTLSPMEGDSSRVPCMKETSYMPLVKKKGSMCSTSFFRKSEMWIFPTTGHVPMNPIS